MKILPVPVLPKAQKVPPAACRRRAGRILVSMQVSPYGTAASSVSLHEKSLHLNSKYCARKLVHKQRWFQKLWRWDSIKQSTVEGRGKLQMACDCQWKNKAWQPCVMLCNDDGDCWRWCCYCCLASLQLLGLRTHLSTATSLWKACGPVLHVDLTCGI